jgi:hypothetical protein
MANRRPNESPIAAAGNDCEIRGRVQGRSVISYANVQPARIEWATR